MILGTAQDIRDIMISVPKIIVILGSDDTVTGIGAGTGNGNEKFEYLWCRYKS